MVVLEILVILAVIGWQLFILYQNWKKANRLRTLFPANSTNLKPASTGEKLRSGLAYQFGEEAINYRISGKDGEFYLVEQTTGGSTTKFLLTDKEVDELPTQAGFKWSKVEETKIDGTNFTSGSNSPDFADINEQTSQLISTYQGNALSVDQLAEPARRKRTQLEESLQATSSTPLYIGLLGTFLGVAIGLSSILAQGIEEEAIERLLLGVIIAMSGSFCGLLFSLLGGAWLRKASHAAAYGLNAWEQHLQIMYGGQLNQDFASSLQGLKGVLQSFNQDFLLRVSDFKDTFSNLYKYTEQQERFLTALQKADVHKISEANLAFFDKIEKNEALFERFGTYMQSLNESLENGRQATHDIREVVTHMRQVGDVQLYLRQNEELIRKQLGYLNAHQEKMDQITHSIQQHYVEASDEIGQLVRQRLKNLQQEEQDAGELLREHFERLKKENVYERIAEQLQPIKQMKTDTEGMKSLFAETLDHLLETQKFIIRKINQDANVQSQLLERIDTLNGQLQKLNEPKNLWQRLSGK